MRVSPVSLTALVLALLIGAGMAATFVGYASPYEENWLMVDAESSISEALDISGGAATMTAIDSIVVAGTIERSSDGSGWVYSTGDYQVSCVDQQCTTILRDSLMSLDLLSEQVALPTTIFVTVLVVGFALLLVGSDAGTGALSTQLTFTPNRRRLMAAKSLVVSAGGMAIMVIAHVVSQSILLVGFIAQRSYQEVGAWEGLVPSVARAVVLAGILSLAAAFVVFLAGDARLAAAVTVVAVLISWFTTPWGLYLETSADAYWTLFNPLVPYAAFLDPPVVVEFYQDAGRYTDSIEVSLLQSFGIALGWLALLGVLGYFRFTRRDIKN